MANNKVLKNSIKDREYNSYIGVNNNNAVVVLPSSGIQKIEVVLSNKFLSGETGELRLPVKPTGAVSFYLVDSNGEFQSQSILTNLVGNEGAVIADGDYYIDENGKITYKANGSGIIGAIYLADLSASSTVIIEKSDIVKLKEADDLIKTFSYLDAGTIDERVSTIIYSSVGLSLTKTETYTYSGSAGSYRVSSISLS